MTTTTRAADLTSADAFLPRHVGPSEADVAAMLDHLGYASLDALIDATIPEAIRFRKPLAIHAARSEHEALAALRAIANKNKVFRSYLGYGYHDTLTPPVIQRNILENPGWYTAYTPYQAEIAQGRLEALLNYQTMIIDLTGLEIANASLLDEGTAAAEAMFMAFQAKGSDAKHTFFIDSRCHPQTIDVVSTRAKARGIGVSVGNAETAVNLALGTAGLRRRRGLQVPVDLHPGVHGAKLLCPPDPPSTKLLGHRVRNAQNQMAPTGRVSLGPLVHLVRNPNLLTADKRAFNRHKRRTMDRVDDPHPGRSPTRGFPRRRSPHDPRL